MTTGREIEAYRRRLSRIKKSFDLTGACLHAVMAWADFEAGEPVVRCGTLSSFRIYTGEGLLGPQVWVEVTVCTACVGINATERECEDAERTYLLFAATEIDLYRNEDGVRDVVETRFPDLVGVGT